MTNASVVELVKLGLGEAVIIQKIRQSDHNFDTSTAGLGQLKAAKVSDNIIMEMMNPGNSASSALPVISPTPTTPQPIATYEPKQTDDLYALFLDGTNKRRLIGDHAHLARAKIKDKEMTLGSLAANAVVTEAVSNVLIQESGQVFSNILLSSVGRSVLFPTGTLLGGMAGGIYVASTTVGSKLLGRSTPSITAVFALNRSTSATVLQTSQPQFEIVYGDIPGIDPDEYQPAIVKLTATKDNYRLRGAARIKDSKVIYEGFVQDAVQTQTQKLARGHMQISPQAALPAGEYGLVLVPVNEKKVVSGDNPQENALLVVVWDFSIR
jgi:hypothetical protein